MIKMLIHATDRKHRFLQIFLGQLTQEISLILIFINAKSNEPWFVVGKDLATNTLLVGQGYHNEYLYQRKKDHSLKLQSLKYLNILQLFAVLISVIDRSTT